MLLGEGLLVNSFVPCVSGESLNGSEEVIYFELLKNDSNLSALILCNKMVRRRCERDLKYSLEKDRLKPNQL